MLWIVGSNGLLGSTLVKRCEGKVPYIATRRNVDIRFLSQIEEFIEEHPQITHIVNCAAFSRVDDAEALREEAFATNAEGPKNLSEIARKKKIALVHISTDYVFGGDIRRPLKESDPTGPTSYYGSTKLIGEQEALKRGACVIRTSWIFGKNGVNFVSKMLQMLQTKKEIRLADDQWGRFTYADDLAEAILLMLDHKGLFQFANLGVATRYEFALFMREEAFLMGLPIMTDAIIPVPASTFPSPCQRPIYSAFDTTKIESFVKIRHWQQALRDFLSCELQTVS